MSDTLIIASWIHMLSRDSLESVENDSFEI